MNRRQFFGLAAATVFVPKFGKWYRQGSGPLVRATSTSLPVALPAEFKVGDVFWMDLSGFWYFDADHPRPEVEQVGRPLRITAIGPGGMEVG